MSEPCLKELLFNSSNNNILFKNKKHHKFLFTQPFLMLTLDLQVSSFTFLFFLSSFILLKYKIEFIIM